MDINKQLQQFVDYFKSNEKNVDEFKIGIEFEHFIIDGETVETISYYGEKGVEDTLKKMLKKGWQGQYEGKYLLGLSKEGKNISLEPGSQLEFSISPHRDILDIEKEYNSFLQDIIPILKEKGQRLINLGYHPKTKIEDIKIIPKDRYDFMYNYFRTKGKNAHNMMKGTASIQLTVDYSSEEDYIKKFKIANALSPVIYGIFDNSPFFEGEACSNNGLRIDIWNNCDDDRSGIVEGTFDNDFGYRKYGEYILNRPPIFIDDGKELNFTEESVYRELFNPDNYTKEEFEHVLTMFFPDVRTKGFIEIRMTDSVPYPLNFSVIALWKGLLYDNKNLEEVYNYIKDISMDDVRKSKIDVINNGLEGKLKDRTIYDISKYLIALSKKGLNDNEKHYLEPLEEMINKKKTPAMITKDRLSQGLKDALNWCMK
ncbi:glutamate--cysteine ligase [Dethiothermospora halolimnae]|uniref:glutamate--cysteine ligase n=1 Tax=Dethiothermospora halolimnae TaxID=3114390 RepID=UPI003CCBB0FF